VERRKFIRAASCLAVAGLVRPGFAQPTYPDWRPAPGTRRNISHNFIADLNPCPLNNCGYSGTSGLKSVMIAWTGGAFAAGFSELGGLLVHGGGHRAYYGNEVYAFNLDTLMWQRLNDPWEPAPGARGWISNDVPLGPTGSWSEGEYAPGIPASSHTYDNVEYLPAALAGNRRGALVRLTGTSNGAYGGGFSGRSHAFDLDTRRWRRYSVNLTTKAEGGGDGNAVCFDPTRKRFWAIGRYYSTVTRYLDIPTRTWHSVRATEGEGHNAGYNMSGAYHPALDLFVVVFHPLNVEGPERGRLWAMSCAEPERGWFRIQQEGPRPLGPAPGLEWCPPLNCMVSYEARGSTRINKLYAPARNPLTSSWRWEEEEIGGDAPAGRTTGAGHYSRFRWAPRAGCFIWADGIRQAVQAWRPRDA
jgi:hypothetical protein